MFILYCVRTTHDDEEYIDTQTPVNILDYVYTYTFGKILGYIVGRGVAISLESG